MTVALRKESVDRNPYIPLAKVRHCESLSARRAWIEIYICAALRSRRNVALRKESVDRNLSGAGAAPAKRMSLSARRAWIEIMQFVPITTSDVLSLSARRAWIEI